MNPPILFFFNTFICLRWVFVAARGIRGVPCRIFSVWCMDPLAVALDQGSVDPPEQAGSVLAAHRLSWPAACVILGP